MLTSAHHTLTQYVWTGSLAINVAFCLGAAEEKATFPVLFPTLVAVRLAPPLLVLPSSASPR